MVSCSRILLAASAGLVSSLLPAALAQDDETEPAPQCDLCGGRGGNSNVATLNRDLTFIPAFQNFGAVLGATSCGDFLTGIDNAVSLLIDPAIAVNLLGMEQAMEYDEACGIFRALGVYCGCNPQEDPCGMCFEGRELDDPDAVISGTNLENIAGYQPTCEWYETQFLPSFEEGGEQCQISLEASRGQCTCSIPGGTVAETEETETTYPTTTTTEPMVNGTTETTTVADGTEPPVDGTEAPPDEGTNATAAAAEDETAAADGTSAAAAAAEEFATTTAATEPAEPEPAVANETVTTEPTQPAEPEPEPEPEFKCDLCAGRGGNDVVVSEARDLTFLPAIDQYGAMLGASTCDKFVTGVDTLMALLADDGVAVGLLNMDAAMPRNVSCPAFQKLGVYCGCEPQDPPCGICGPEEGELENPDTYIPGTLLETLVQYEPTCGFYNDVYMPNDEWGNEWCEADREVARAVCRCSGETAGVESDEESKEESEEPTASPTPRPTVGMEGIRSSPAVSHLMVVGHRPWTAFAGLVAAVVLNAI